MIGPDLTPEILRRQLKLHLESLKAAGVEFIPSLEPSVLERLAPKAAPPTPAPQRLAPTPAPPREPASSPAPARTIQPSAPQPVAKRAETNPVVPAEPVDGRSRELSILAVEISNCSRCSQMFSTRTQTVFGSGVTDPLVCFIGDAPGAEEDKTGKSFVGPAGKLLDKIIAACHLKQDEIYLCNIVKCRPPGNRPPNAEETGNCQDYLEKQLDLVKPKFIVALGVTVARHLLGNPSAALANLRGEVRAYRGIPLVCTYHPEEILKRESLKKDCWEDMKMLLKAMGRTVPTT